MRKLPWLIGTLVILFLVGSLAALWSPDPMDRLGKYCTVGSVGLTDDWDPSTGQPIKMMERHSNLVGVSEKEVGDVLREYYSLAKGYKWRPGPYGITEAHDALGDYVCYAPTIDGKWISVTEKVRQTRKQLLWRKIGHRGGYYGQSIFGR